MIQSTSLSDEGNVVQFKLTESLPFLFYFISFVLVHLTLDVIIFIMFIHLDLSFAGSNI